MAKKKKKKAKKNERKLGLNKAALKMVESKPFQKAVRRYAKFLRSQPPPPTKEDDGALTLFAVGD